jgi:cytochrome c oxidase subunit II
VNPEFDGQMPKAMSSGAADYDTLYRFMYWFSLAFTVVIVAVCLYFIVKYKRKPGDLPEKTLVDMTKLEIFWTVTPLFFIVFLFHIGFKDYVKNAVAADGAIEIRVRAKQWLWDFEYPNGMRENNVILFPVNTPIKMVMSSDDVIHSFYIPEFRLKKDVVPGLYSTVTFTPTVLGDAHVFCAEFCGTSHSGMLATVKVVTRAEYEAYIKEGPKKPEDISEAQWGEKLFVQNGCSVCHSRDGVTKSQCPNLKGIWHRDETMTTNQVINVDENYIQESIRKPQAKIVMGYTTILMPTFALTDRQVDAIIAYFKTLK